MSSPPQFDPATIKDDPLTWMFWKKKRYVIVVLAFFGYFNLYTARVSLSIAITEMINHTETDKHGNEYYVGDFNWEPEDRGLILSSYFYGYLSTQFLGGFLASYIGGNHMFGLGIGAGSILTLFTPLAAHHSLQMLVVVQMFKGIFGGVSFPCIAAVWSRWAPPLERSRMAAWAYSGAHTGTIVGMPCSGLLATHFGWESVFYVFGAIGIVWCLIWTVLVKAGPEQDRFCSGDEKKYIVATLGGIETVKIKHPWKSILTSKAVWAIMVSFFCENWGFYTMLTQLPTFLKETLDYDLTKAGFIAGLPYLAMALLLLVSGYLADWSQQRGYLTTTQVRKYFNCSAFMTQATFMLISASYMSSTLIIGCVIIAVGLGAFAWTGFAVNALDLAPRHASVIIGIGKTVATLPGVLSPILTGYIVQNNSYDEWRIVFCISAGLYLFGCVVYWFLCSGELQKWAQRSENAITQQPINK